MLRVLAIAALALAACADGPGRASSAVSHAHPVVDAGRSGVEDAPAVADGLVDDGAVASDIVVPDAVADTVDDVVADAVADAVTVDAAGPDVVDASEVAPDAGEVDVAPDVSVPAAGTLADPVEVDRWPWVVDDDTTLAPESQLDRYGCAPQTGEAGPERVYHLTFDAPGELVAEVGEADGVDVDLHLLAALPAAGAREAACVARANTRLAVDVDAAEYWLVVDSYSNDAGVHAGAHRLAIEHTVLDRWQVVEVAPGVVWKKKVYASYAGGRQTVNALEVDLGVATVRPYVGDGCLHPSVTAPVHGAIAAINAGFFDTGPGTCPPLDLVKIDGVVRSLNHLTGGAQRSFGLDAAGLPMMAWVDANADWPEAAQAIGSYPSLVTDGAVVLEPDRTSDFFVGRHPRTAIGLTDDGRLLLVTVDGRTAAGAGMTLAALAQHMINLGAEQAVNLDGGGSTAMWVRDQSVSGVVSSPSDDGDDDHGGERGVSDLLLVVPRPP